MLAEVNPHVGQQICFNETQDLIMECSGPDDLNKHLHIKNLLRLWKVDIICLQETKLRWVDKVLTKVCGAVHMWDGRSSLLMGCQVMCW